MKKIIIFSLIATLCMPTTFILASETPSKEEASSEDILDATFQDMMETLKSGGEVSFATSLEKTGGLIISTEPKFNLEGSSIDWNNLDASLTNMGFNAVSASLANNYSSIDLSGKAGGCTKLFESSFGTLANDLTLEEPSIPSNFNADKMLKENQSSINAAYVAAVTTNVFKTTKDTIGVQSIFNQAAAGPTKEEGKTIDSLMTSMGLDKEDRNMLKNYSDQKLNINNNHKTELKVDDPAYSKEDILANTINSYSSCKIAESYLSLKRLEETGTIDSAEDLIYDMLK